MAAVVLGSSPPRLQTAAMFAFRSHICIALLSAVCNVYAFDSYTAAVYEYVPIVPEPTNTPVTAAQALELMNKNMDILEPQIQAASKQAASIIVTPELAIFGWGFTRETVFPYLEDIPDPSVDWVPCSDPKRFGPAPVQQRLSCMAKNSSIYVVANIGDKKPCSSSDVACPKDGRYQYNTNVVFDPYGRLVARYHKYNLFQGEVQFDKPKEPELVTFNTPFGKFGIFTCFDILFYKPAAQLVVNLTVDTILFPTAWMNVLPHLTAIEFHSAWAMGMGVNMLASNTHNTKFRMTGSGIYAPHEPRAYYYNAENEDGYLLLAEVFSQPRLSSTYAAVRWSQYANYVQRFPTESQSFVRPVFFDNFTFIKLEHAEANQTVCQKDLCCHLSYGMVEKRADEVYVLGAFDGMHVVEGEYYLQICTLLKCKTTDLDTCGESVNASLTKFQFFSLSGTFGTSFVFPEVLLSGVHLAPREFQILPDGRLVSQSDISSRSLLTATLFGRWYERDPDPLVKSAAICWNPYSFLLFTVSILFYFAAI